MHVYCIGFVFFLAESLNKDCTMYANIPTIIIIHSWWRYNKKGIRRCIFIKFAWLLTHIGFVSVLQIGKGVLRVAKIKQHSHGTDILLHNTCVMPQDKRIYLQLKF